MTGKEAIARIEKLNKYKNDYQKQNYDRVSVLLPKGMKEQINARSGGESLNGLINRLLWDYLNEK